MSYPEMEKIDRVGRRTRPYGDVHWKFDGCFRCHERAHWYCEWHTGTDQGWGLYCDEHKMTKAGYSDNIVPMALPPVFLF